jgi:hypothetical protein
VNRAMNRPDRNGVLLLSLLAVWPALHPPPLSAQTQPGLVVSIEGGEGPRPVDRPSGPLRIRVQADRTGRAIAGATVTFTIVSGAAGAAASFLETGGRTFTATTGPDGMAVSSGLMPNSTPGAYTIEIEANSQGMTAGRTTARMQSTTVSPPVKSPAKLIAIFAAAAIASVAYVGVTNRNPKPPPSATVIIIGSPAISRNAVTPGGR